MWRQYCQTRDLKIVIPNHEYGENVKLSKERILLPVTRWCRRLVNATVQLVNQWHPATGNGLH